MSIGLFIVIRIQFDGSNQVLLLSHYSSWSFCSVTFMFLLLLFLPPLSLLIMRQGPKVFVEAWGSDS